MTARMERRIVHAALKSFAATYGREGTLTVECVDLWRLAVDCTTPRPWWRFW